MPQIGEQADVLRALGRELDQHQARGIQITAHETFLSVGWGQRAQVDAYQEHHLATLRMQAHAMRTGTGGDNPTGSLSELLRTLGQELDQGKIEANGITQEAEGFRVSGVQSGRYFTRLYRTSELYHLSRDRREARGKGSAAASEPAQPFDEVTVGLRVYTQDGEQLGTVGELAGRALKVMDASGQFGYWLRAPSIALVQAGEWAQLAFPRDQLDRHRSWSAPE
jgi:hypothetical protein